MKCLLQKQKQRPLCGSSDKNRTTAIAVLAASYGDYWVLTWASFPASLRLLLMTTPTATSTTPSATPATATASTMPFFLPPGLPKLKIEIRLDCFFFLFFCMICRFLALKESLPNVCTCVSVYSRACVCVCVSVCVCARVCMSVTVKRS